MKKSLVLNLSVMMLLFLFNGIAFAEVSIKIIEPKIEPKNELTVEEKYIDIKGSINIKGKNIHVQIPERRDGIVDKEGNFELKNILLDNGPNYIEIEFNDGAKFLGRKTIIVYFYDPRLAPVEITPEKGGCVSVDDPSSSLFGAEMIIPPGSATRSYEARIEEAAYVHKYELQYDRTAVGPYISFWPIGEKCLKPITITLPIDISLLPKDSSINDIKALAADDHGWIEYPILERTDKFIKFRSEHLGYGCFVPVIVKNLKPGEVRVITNTHYYSGDGQLLVGYDGWDEIILDGIPTGIRTPATLTNILPGEHTIKVRREGYNEVVKKFTVPKDKGIEVQIDLKESKN